MSHKHSEESCESLGTACQSHALSSCQPDLVSAQQKIPNLLTYPKFARVAAAAFQQQRENKHQAAGMR